MKRNARGRILAWILTFMLVFTYMPQIAFATEAVTPNTATEATEVHDHDHDHEAEAADQDVAEKG